MKYTTLHIKNMVCNRCIKVIKSEFKKLKIDIDYIELGTVYLNTPLNESMLSKIKEVLNEDGFELIGDKKSKIIDRIKTLIIEITHYGKKLPESVNISEFISKEIGYDYSYLSNLFSSVEGITIEKYTINQKIEKVKELLVYDELSLKEISFKLDYSSIQHLSNQFKKITGMTPSYFKKLKGTRRKPLDEV